MQRSSRWPGVNPLRAIAANDRQQGKYNTFPFDRGFWFSKLNPWRVQRDYYQQFQNSDTIAIYFDSGATQVRVTAIDLEGRAVDIGGPYLVDYFIAEPDNVYPDNDSGGTYQYYSFYWELALYGIPAGVYLLVIEQLYEDGSSWLVTEPVSIRKRWPGTMLLEYNRNFNDLVAEPVLYEQVPGQVHFQLRIDSDLSMPEPYSHDTAFIDMSEQMVNLQSHYYRVYNFTIGRKGLPDWLVDKAGRALSTDNLRIDGKSFAKDQGATFTVKKYDYSERLGAVIKLREGDAQHDGVVADWGPRAILSLTTDDAGAIILPLAWPRLQMREATISATAINEVAKIFDHLGEIDNYLDMLNLNLEEAFNVSAGIEIRGYLFREDNKIYYQNAIGENWSDLSNDYLYELHDRIDLFVQTYDDGILRTRLNPTTGGYFHAIVDYGDGSAPELIEDSHGLYLNHEYPAIGTVYNLRIFHFGTNGAFGAQLGQFLHGIGGASGVNVIGINVGNNVTDVMTAIYIVNNPAQPGFSGGDIDVSTFLSRCRNTIATLVIDDVTITSFASGLFGSVFGGFGAQLYRVELQCGMDTTAVNDVINNFAANVAYTTVSGAFFFIRQDGTAPPTGTALSFLDGTLAGLSWSVGHD